jgi:hypothetical protein
MINGVGSMIVEESRGNWGPRATGRAWNLRCHFVLDNDERERRLPGYSSILLTPEEGIPEVHGKLEREILVEAIELSFGQLGALG